jgi:DNA-binding transcriptional LysR family regulator
MDVWIFFLRIIPISTILEFSLAKKFKKDILNHKKKLFHNGAPIMDERDWLILKTLNGQNNISKTARSLYISQPALTKRIKQMEKEFQVSIILRGSKGIQFTPEGEYLAKCAEDMLERIRQMKEKVWSMDEDVSGTLRLGVSNFFSKHILPQLLKHFRCKFPKVEFMVLTGWSKEVLSLIQNQKVHIGFVRGEYPWADAKQLLFTENICVISENRIELEELPNHSRVDYKTDVMLKGLIDHWWSGTFAKQPLVGMEVENAETCIEMVRNGLGYGIVPRVLLHDDKELHQRNILDEKGNPIIRKTWMLYQEETLRMKLVKEFVNFIKGYGF